MNYYIVTIRGIAFYINEILKQIYPNPAFTEFIIDMNSDSDKEITLEVYDVLGNLLIKEKHQITEGVNSLKTDIEKYHNGMYFVRLVDTNSNSIYTQRVIKQ